MQTALDAKADKTALDLKADKTALDPINTALNKITTPSSIGKIPTSCGDLKSIGFVKSGIFSIMNSKRVKNVYCDFTKTTEAELQKMIGTVNVKSAAVYFHAQMSKTYSAALTTVPFDSIKLNVGTALNPATGIFVAPTSGKYYFAYSGLSDAGVRARVRMQMANAGTTNWKLVGEGYGDPSYKTFSMHATLELVKGDQVRLYLSEGIIHEANLYFNYVGWLLEENELTV
ncbi:caprin-2-like isoform X2 [Daphnia pulicaria]|uniref:caprin-2-like isoform X2 n=1 Tax=Daphnia pulicaria TaxID=35523 RepID=UPI001EEB6898|nr:caprin-2-like isoform X2 [Daphnia pulicaria]